MRSWFPFTDYDFYGYLTSGSAMLFACDLAFNGGAVTLRAEWTFVQVVLAVALAYATGQLLAWPSSILLEHVLTHRVLRSPFNVQVGAAEPRLLEKAVGAILTGRDYRPLEQGVRQKMFDRASGITGMGAAYYLVSPGRLFGPAYEFTKSVPRTSERMDQFRNLYGLMRNLALTSFASAAVFGWRGCTTDNDDLWTWAAVALAAGFGFLIRYLKFYGAFASEITRCFAFHDPSRGE